MLPEELSLWGAYRAYHAGLVTPLAAAMSRGDAPWSAALAAFGAVHGLSPADFAHFGVGPALVAVSALFLALLPYQILSTLPRGVHRALGFDAWLIQPVICAARSATARISSVRVCAVWLFNNVVLGSLGAPNLARMFLYVGAETSPDRMPTARSAAGAFVAAILVEDVLFTFGHMLLHTPRLYKAIHKLHHEYKVFTFGCWVVLSVVGYMSGI